MEGVRYSEGIPQGNVVERVSVRWEFLCPPFLHLYPACILRHRPPFCASR